MISVHRNTKLRVVTDGKTELRSVEDLNTQGTFSIVDWFGKESEAKVVDKSVGALVAFKSISGEIALFGPAHTVFCREPNQGEFKRRSVKDITSPVYVRLPQRKLHIDHSVTNYLDADDEGLFVHTEDHKVLLPTMEEIASAGATVIRDKAKPAAYVDRGRPTCFISKLLNGNLQYDLENELGDLISKAIVQTPYLYNARYLDLITKYQTIFEGNSLFNDVMLFPQGQRANANEKCYTIALADDETPLETAWFCT